MLTGLLAIGFPAIATSCNSYFCWGFQYVWLNRTIRFTAKRHYGLKEHMVLQGFGYKRGVDLAGRETGLGFRMQFYDKAYRIGTD